MSGTPGSRRISALPLLRRASVKLGPDGFGLVRTASSTESESRRAFTTSMTDVDTEAGVSGGLLDWLDAASDMSAPSNASSRRSSYRRASVDRHNAAPATGSDQHGRGPARDIIGEIQGWEQLRTDFPLEVLDSFADFYEKCRFDAFGRRHMTLRQVQDVMARVLGFPPHAAKREAQARGLLSSTPVLKTPANEVGLDFNGFSGFLDFVRAAVERLGDEAPAALWSEADFAHIKAVFAQHTQSSQRLPVPWLFAATMSLGFEELHVEDLEEQKWFANVVRMCLGSKVQGRSPSRAEASSLSLDDFIKVITKAVRERERGRRREEFAAERAVCSLAGFGPLEVADMAEMHKSFVQMRGEGRMDSLSRLMKLLSSCGMRALAPAEVAALRAILSDQPTTGGKVANRLPQAEAVPFHVFLEWMRCIFDAGIGDLELQGQLPVTKEEVEGRTGFTAAMLREYLATQEVASGQRRVSRRGGSISGSNCSSRLSWAVNKKPRDKQGTFGSRSGSRAGSRSGSARPRRRSVGVITSRSRRSSRIVPRQTSHTMEGGLEAFVGLGEPAGDGDEHGVLKLAGLPSSEAMLGRKMFRACTADLNDIDDSATPQVPSGDEGAGGGVGTEDAGAKEGAEASLASHAPATLAPPSSAATEKKERHVKTAQDSEALLQEALAKLALLEQERSLDDANNNPNHVDNDRPTPESQS